MKKYLYGMRLRGFSLGAQPKGTVERRDDPGGKYWDVIAYAEPLDEWDLFTYSLDFIGEED